MTRKAFCATLLMVFTAGLFPFASAAEKPTVSLLVHPGDSIRTEALSQVTIYLEEDLLKRIKQYGYKTRSIYYRQDHVPERNNFLLAVTIVQYIPQVHLSKSLAVRYELTGPDHNVLLSEEKSESTRRHWTRLVTAINDRMLILIDEKINETLSKTLSRD